MQHRLPSIVLATAALIALAASPAAAAPGTAAGGRNAATADHLDGTFRACGRIVAYTAPVLGVSDGSITIAGVVDGADHTFPIDDAAPVNPLVATLAAGEEWTCLHLMGDGAGLLVDVAVADHTSCGPLADVGGTLVLQAGSTDPSTTTTLDGDAATIIAADADLASLLSAITTVDGAAEACLEFQLAADGTVAAILLDYAEPGATPARIACGIVNGTSIPYRDPASQPFPEGDTVSVAGFAIDASLLAAPYAEVLAFHLDAIAEVCLLVEVEDTVIVDAAALNLGETEVCGELEVVGGLVFVDTVVVSQGLTSLNFAEPASASIGMACWSARAQAGIASGTLEICGDYESSREMSFTMNGVTFFLEAPLDVIFLPSSGADEAAALVGPNPFEPFGPDNPAQFLGGSIAGCGLASPSPLPDTSAVAPAAPGPVMLVLPLTALWVLAAVGLVTVRIRRR